MVVVLIRGEHVDTDTQRGDHHVTMKRERLEY
jgi:hypothetical protein